MGGIQDLCFAGLEAVGGEDLLRRSVRYAGEARFTAWQANLRRLR
jgi:hypothetical protein